MAKSSSKSEKVIAKLLREAEVADKEWSLKEKR